MYKAQVQKSHTIIRNASCKRLNGDGLEFDLILWGWLRPEGMLFDKSRKGPDRTVSCAFRTNRDPNYILPDALPAHFTPRAFLTSQGHSGGRPPSRMMPLEL